MSDRPLRVLLACSHFWPSIGGVETVVENLGAHLAQLGHRVTVATWEHPDRRLSIRRGMNVISLNPHPQPGARQLRELVTSDQYDACVLFADPLNWIFWAMEDLPTTTRTRLIGQPIITADGYSRWRNNQDFRRRLSQILRRCNSIVALTIDGHEVRYLGEEKISFVYLPNAAIAPETPGASFRERFGIAAHQAVFLHVANLWPVKNHLGLMWVMSRLAGEWRLVMAGYPSADASYVSEVRSAARRDTRFLLIPGLSQPDVAAAMATANAVLLASFGEACPVTMLEAMSHAKPWLATPDCGGLRDKAGGIVAPLEEFPGLLQRLLTQPELTQALGECGHEHWRACFNWHRVAGAWNELLTTGQVRTTFDRPASLRDKMVRLRETLAQPVAVRPEPAVKVSVIIPTFNRPEMLLETLRSVSRQTFQDFEMLVINDAGTDVAALINDLNSDGRIRYLQHSVNRGRSAARNTGLRAARGKYVAYLDDDDIFYPEHLSTLLQFLEGHTGAVAYTDAYRAQQVFAGGQYRTVRRDIPYSTDWDNDRVLINNLVPICCVMHEVNCVDQVGYFDESLSTHEDWDFWIRLSRRYPFHHIKQATCEFRTRTDGTSASSGERVDFLRTARMIFDKHRDLAADRIAVEQGRAALLRGLEAELRSRFAPAIPDAGHAFPVPGSAGAAPPHARNSPCPCGSGLRYKHCHGRCVP